MKIPQLLVSMSHGINQCPEQKQPNERVCTVMEVGSSFEKIDNILIYRVLKIYCCKSWCHSFPRKINKFQIGGQKEDKKFGA